MNCKPGDLAVIVSGVKDTNIGRIVRCVRITHFRGLRMPDGTLNEGVVWEIDRTLTAWSGKRHNFALDKRLRPIRDPGDDATDETLLWVGSPHKETA
jgi:hypothetical protein